MLFKALLKELVTKTEDAEGAIFLDREGEAVDWYAHGDGERLRLRAAYLAVVFHACRTSVSSMELGQIRYLSMEYDGAVFVMADLEGDYFFVLELSYFANVAQALFRIQPTLAALRREIAA
ncbi:MAG TPA: hypothetical protein VNO70_09815 [Blastocatellia bacterium]|nr:hypothetical protein [Blastocatellia bacterium]